MVDALDSKSSIRKDVEVRVLSLAQIHMTTIQNNIPLIVVCGPTATGKSDYAVQLAKTHNGEIISADSRQVYKGFDLGSGKITTEEMQGIHHHLLDVASPTRTFTVAQFQKKAQQVIADILKRGKTPILCGGTGLYIDAVVYNTVFPKVPANQTLRNTLNKKSAAELSVQLEQLDPERFATIDTHNKVRLIRAIEIASVLGAVPPIQQRTSPYNVQWHYLDFPDDVLKARIHKRLVARLDAGMIAEVQALRKTLSWKRLESFGLEYRYVALYLQDKLSCEQMIQELAQATWSYVKRQRTWCKKYAGKSEKVW